MFLNTNTITEAGEAMALAMDTMVEPMTDEQRELSTDEAFAEWEDAQWLAMMELDAAEARVVDYYLDRFHGADPETNPWW